MNSATALFVLFAVAHARFGQEQIPIPAVAAVQGGEPGAAPTIAGAAVSDLLAGSNACAKLQRADQILEELGTGADAIAAAIGMVSAEKNVNPFVQQQPAICNDPTLPANEILRGITPLVDPDFANAAIANALSAVTVATPLDATGKSVADLLVENGFTDFLGQGVDGTMAPVADFGNAAATDAAATAVDTAVAAVDTASATDVAATAVDTAAAAVTDQCAALVAEALASASAAAGATTVADAAAMVTETATADTAIATDATATETAAAAVDTAVAGAGADAGAADFGTCDPTMKFEGGLGGRPPTEFTFQSQDPNIEAIQQEALNPNIITNRICDELTNQCGANDAAKAVCDDAQSQILALGTRDVTTAETWNELLGFAGTVTNPDGGPATPEEAGAAARMRMARRRRSFRA